MKQLLACFLVCFAFHSDVAFGGCVLEKKVLEPNAAFFLGQTFPQDKWFKIRSMVQDGGLGREVDINMQFIFVADADNGTAVMQDPGEKVQLFPECKYNAHSEKVYDVHYIPVVMPEHVFEKPLVNIVGNHRSRVFIANCGDHDEIVSADFQSAESERGFDSPSPFYIALSVIFMMFCAALLMFVAHRTKMGESWNPAQRLIILAYFLAFILKPVVMHGYVRMFEINECNLLIDGRGFGYLVLEVLGTTGMPALFFILGTGYGIARPHLHWGVWVAIFTLWFGSSFPYVLEFVIFEFDSNTFLPLALFANVCYYCLTLGVYIGLITTTNRLRIDQNQIHLRLYRSLLYAALFWQISNAMGMLYIESYIWGIFDILVMIQFAYFFWIWLFRFHHNLKHHRNPQTEPNASDSNDANSSDLENGVELRESSIDASLQRLDADLDQPNSLPYEPPVSESTTDYQALEST